MFIIVDCTRLTLTWDVLKLCMGAHKYCESAD